ncbi:cytidylate kinase [Lacunisphaera limnophila]|uniref:Cytidylate kinase n=1 Tax=Lacunisphaera limnophila TaxID=1838286 RepID=A0A1D8AWC8_9BACT|nr:cytidylate kinase-like family protein [Lacunisphaera limnophila]AOS45165.1 cytidylate kinase [Lacunisphaera limnophila]
MTTHPYLHHGLTILRARLTPSRSPFATHPGQPPAPFVTLSRETCAGATTLGQHLAPLLNTQLGEEGRSWMFLDKDLIHQALSHHHLPENLAEFLPEDRLPEIKGLIGEIVGLHPPLWELEHRVAEAIHKFAQLGRVILSGRAAHLITRDLPGGIHVRLIAPLETRIRRAQAMQAAGREMAANFIQDNDQARARHVRTNFDQDINDPHAYDLVINTAHIPPASAAHLVLQAMLDRVTALTPVS